MESAPAAEPVLWKTAAAAVVALIVWGVVGSLISIFVGLANLISNDWSPVFIDFWSQLVGGIGGVFAARFACDKMLLPYSRHVVFFILLLVSALTFYYQWHHAASRAQLFDYGANLIASVGTAYYLFWLNKELN